MESYAKKRAIFIYDLGSLSCQFMQICRFLLVLIGLPASRHRADSHLHARMILRALSANFLGKDILVPFTLVHPLEIFRSRIFITPVNKSTERDEPILG